MTLPLDRTSTASCDVATSTPSVAATFALTITVFLAGGEGMFNVSSGEPRWLIETRNAGSLSIAISVSDSNELVPITIGLTLPPQEGCECQVLLKWRMVAKDSHTPE